MKSIRRAAACVTLGLGLSSGAMALAVDDVLECSTPVTAAFRCDVFNPIEDNRPAGYMAPAVASGLVEFYIGFSGPHAISGRDSLPYLSADFTPNGGGTLPGGGVLTINGLRLSDPLQTTILTFRNLSQPFAQAQLLTSTNWEFGSIVGLPTTTDWNQRISLSNGLLSIDFRNVKIDPTTNGADVLAISVSPVPEPGTIALMLAGLGVVGFLAKRRGVLGGQPQGMPA